MGNREVDGFQVWAEVSQQGAELAGTFVLMKAIDCKVGTKRFRVITVHTFTSLEAAQAAPIQVVQAITSVSETGVPSPLVY
ncbi:hypothetical protein [Comamonas thiooxydans]|uniref:hypothetical protein n=1 Tax=Comamonas thiooxydans TaxID=363952 RepID=UPI00050EEB51|nr:hypothetical protein [Comamonas thiooxydans]KGG86707.1 hypothetical protein P609_11035 [Comamonas thiooxydans]